MAEPRLMKIDRVKVGEIVATGRLRPVSEAGVESLMASIAEIGVMKDAVHVRQKKGGQLVLIAGGHRLEAAKRLGWDEIEAKVWADVTDDWARLMEIDDNIAGAELNALDTALFLAERKRVYERLHPETKADTFRGNQHTGKLVADIVSFATATAEKFGMTDRHVRRLISAGECLDPRDVQLLRKAPRQITLKDLGEIAKIADAPERYDVVEALANGQAKSAADARRQWKDGHGQSTPVEDPVEAALKALKSAWSRAPKESRRRFVRDHGEALAALMYEGASE
jgi:ParB family chromosome partitioning protein